MKELWQRIETKMRRCWPREKAARARMVPLLRNLSRQDLEVVEIYLDELPSYVLVKSMFLAPLERALQTRHTVTLDRMILLIRDPLLGGESMDTKNKLFELVCKCPTRAVIANLRALLAKPWFRAENARRRAWMIEAIAFLSHYRAASGGESRELLERSLEWLLKPDSPFAMAIGEGQGYGYAHGGTLYLIPQDECGPPTAAQFDSHAIGRGEVAAKSEVFVETFVHETCHNLWADRAGSTFDFFLAEAFAWAMGFKVMRNRFPNREEMWGRIRFLLGEAEKDTLTSPYSHSLVPALRIPEERRRFHLFFISFFGDPHVPESTLDDTRALFAMQLRNPRATAYDPALWQERLVSSFNTIHARKW